MADELKQLAKHLKSFQGVVSVVTTLLPIAGFAAPSLIPQWPELSEVLAVAISVATILVVLLFHKNTQAEIIHGTAKKMLWLSVFLVILYLLLNSLLVVDLKGEPKLKGFVFSSEASAYLSKDNISPKDFAAIFGHFGYDSADRIWSDFEVTRTVFAATFFAMFATLASGFAALVLEDFRLHNPLILVNGPDSG